MDRNTASLVSASIRSRFPSPPSPDFYEQAPEAPWRVAPPVRPSSIQQTGPIYVASYWLPCPTGQGDTLLLFDMHKHEVDLLFRESPGSTRTSLYMASCLVSSKVIEICAPGLFDSLETTNRPVRALVYTLKEDFLQISAMLQPNSGFKVLLVPDFEERLNDILNILHCSFDCIPDPLNPESLAKRLDPFAKYDCFNLLLLWKEKWTSCLEGFPFEEHEIDHWARIAAIFDLSDVKTEVLRRLTPMVSSESRCATYALTDRWVGCSDKDLSIRLDKYSEDMTKYIFRVRAESIRKITALLQDLLAELSDKDTINSHEACKTLGCRSQALGSLIPSLDEYGLWPLVSSTKPETWHASVETLVEQLNFLEISTFHRGSAANEVIGNGSKQSSVVQATPDEDMGTHSGSEGGIPIQPGSGFLLIAPIEDIGVEVPVIEVEEIAQDIELLSLTSGKNQHGPCPIIAMFLEMRKNANGIHQQIDGVY